MNISLSQGFRNILLGRGGASESCLRRAHGALLAPAHCRSFPGVSLEVSPMRAADSLPLVAAGAEGLVVYRRHTASLPMRDAPDRARRKATSGGSIVPSGPIMPDFAVAWSRRALRPLGLAGGSFTRPRRPPGSICCAHVLEGPAHREPARLRPAAGEVEPPHPLPDREFIQFLCALRVTFPKIGIVMSTREPAELRDATAPLGVTMMSAGSHTEPGGYTGRGKAEPPSNRAGPPDRRRPAMRAEGQFFISDERSPEILAARLRALGLDPVWKGWDAAILNAA